MGGMIPGGLGSQFSLGNVNTGLPAVSGFNIPTFGGGIPNPFGAGGSRMPVGGGLGAGLPSTFATNFGAPGGFPGRGPLFGGPAASYQNGPYANTNPGSPVGATPPQLMAQRAQALGIDPSALAPGGTFSPSAAMSIGTGAGFTPDQIQAAITKLQSSGLLG